MILVHPTLLCPTSKRANQHNTPPSPKKWRHLTSKAKSPLNIDVMGFCSIIFSISIIVKCLWVSSLIKNMDDDKSMDFVEEHTTGGFQMFSHQCIGCLFMIWRRVVNGCWQTKTFWRRWIGLPVFNFFVFQTYNFDLPNSPTNWFNSSTN